MGGSTQVHAGFILTGEEIWETLPKHENDPDIVVFGTHTYKPFTDAHYAQLIGRSFKKKLSFSGSGRLRKLVTTLSINPPQEGTDKPYSLELSSKAGKSVYPAPKDTPLWDNSRIVTCCKTGYKPGKVKFCGECGKELVVEDGVRYVGRPYDLLGAFGVHWASIEGRDIPHVFDLHEAAGIKEVTVPLDWDKENLYEIDDQLATELDCVVSNIGHMSDFTVLLAPKGGRYSADLWCDSEPYIKLSEVDRQRKEIEELKTRIEALGFKNLQFVFHPEWIE